MLSTRTQSRSDAASQGHVASRRDGHLAVLADWDPRIPVRLLTGAPKSGSTSVIRGLMTGLGRQSRAHIVSDHRIYDGLPSGTSRPDERTTILENGSVCYAMRACDVVEALNHLHLGKLGLGKARLDYDEILVEIPSKYSPMAVISQLLSDTRLALTFRFDGIVHVIDAVASRQNLGRPSPHEAMIARADILVVSKLDLLSDADGEAVLADIARINPFALSLTARRGVVPASLLMSWDHLGPDSAGLGAAAAKTGGLVCLPPLGIDGPVTNALRCVVSNPLNDSRINADTGVAPIRAARITLSGDADIFRVAAGVAKLAEQTGADLYRLKCITSVPRSELPIFFRCIDGNFIPPSWGERGNTQETQLTVVGRNFEPRELMADVAAWMWDAPAIARGEHAPF